MQTVHSTTRRWCQMISIVILETRRNIFMSCHMMWLRRFALWTYCTQDALKISYEKTKTTMAMMMILYSKRLMAIFNSCSQTVWFCVRLARQVSQLSADSLCNINGCLGHRKLVPKMNRLIIALLPATSFLPEYRRGAGGAHISD